MTAYLVALSAVMCTVCGQLSLKAAARQYATPTAARSRSVEFAWLGGGYGLLLAAVLVSAHALRYLEANVLVSLTALAYPFVVGLSRVFFGERMNRNQLLGLLLVCGGVMLYNLG